MTRDNRPGANTKLVPFLILMCTIGAVGCSTTPDAGDYPDYLERAQTQSREDISVTVSVPTAQEAEAIYGVDVIERYVQPVWLEIRNESADLYWLLTSAINFNSFTPSEVAYAFQSGQDVEHDAALADRFDNLAFKNPIMPGTTVSGFVLTNLDEGYKAVDVDLISRGHAESFVFTTWDPTFPSESSVVDFDKLYAPDELIVTDDEAELRRQLEELPCCTTNSDGTEPGDPLNLVLVGSRLDIFSAGLRRKWDPTEILHSGSVLRTIGSFLQGYRYRYSPISPLYFCGRPQDVAAQKVRSTINERNHLRIWLTPIRFKGQPVWIGQISRDIGVKYTLKSPTISTHVIDPDVDEARRYFLEDMAYSQALYRYGFVEGVGAASKANPRFNLVDDPYYTDGLRAVMFIGSRPHSLGEIDRLD